MNLTIQGIGWVTATGIGPSETNDSLSLGSGALPTLRSRQLLGEIHKRFGRFDDYTKAGFGAIALALRDAGLECEAVNKVTEGRPHIVDMIKNDEINLIINTTEGSQAIADSATIRSNALQHKVTYTTTLTGGLALCTALKQTDISEVNRLQDLHQEICA